MISDVLKQSIRSRPASTETACSNIISGHSGLFCEARPSSAKVQGICLSVSDTSLSAHNHQQEPSVLRLHFVQAGRPRPFTLLGAVCMTPPQVHLTVKGGVRTSEMGSRV